MSFADDGPVLLNNPDDPAEMAAFNDFVHQLVDDHVALKPIKLLEPIGPSFPVGRRVTEVVPERSGNTHAQRTTVTDTASLSLLNSLKDGALRVGNAACESPAEKGCAQLYKENPAQVAVCVGANYVAERDSFEFNGHAIYATPRSVVHRDAEQALRRRGGHDTGLSERAREDNRDALLQKVTTGFGWQAERKWRYRLLPGRQRSTALWDVRPNVSNARIQLHSPPSNRLTNSISAALRLSGLPPSLWKRAPTRRSKIQHGRFGA